MTPRPLALLVAAALAMPACSASGSDSSTPTTTAATSTSEAGPGSSTSTTAPDPADADQVLVDAVDATLALARIDVESVSELRVSGKLVLLEVDAAVDYEARVADAELEVEAPTGDNDIALRADGTSLWLRSSSIEVPEGKTWVEGRADLLDADNFQPGGLLGTVLVLRAAQDTTVEGTEEIDGVETTVYRTSFTYDDAVEAAGDDVEVLRSALSLTYDEPVPLDVTAWVDADGVVRRLHIEIDPDDETPFDGRYDLDLSSPDEVEPPDAPADEEVLRGSAADRLLDQVLADA